MMGADANRRGRDEDSRLERRIVCETCELSVWEIWECSLCERLQSMYHGRGAAKAEANAPMGMRWCDPVPKGVSASLAESGVYGDNERNRA